MRALRESIEEQESALDQDYTMGSLSLSPSIFQCASPSLGRHPSGPFQADRQPCK